MPVFHQVMNSVCKVTSSIFAPCCAQTLRKLKSAQKLGGDASRQVTSNWPKAYSIPHVVVVLCLAIKAGKKG